MEFFRTIDTQFSEKQIQEKLSVDRIERWSTLFFPQYSGNKDYALVAGIWGEFTMKRQNIKGGCRYILVECPNAIAWTVTAGFAPNPTGLVIHLTINRKTICAEFLAEIEEFLDDIAEQIKGLSTLAVAS